MTDKIKRQRIYKHTELNQADADRMRPLIESAFSNELGAYNHGNRKHIAAERAQFAAEQFANRCRISKNMGVSPLNEDAQIFGQAFPQFKNLFESYSMPGNVIGMGDVVNPMEGNRVAGGMWNAGYKPGSGDMPSFLFGLQSQIALHCVGFDLMPVIAVDTPKVEISYVDTVYGGGTFDDTDNLPSFVEVAASVFKRSFIKEKKLKRAVSKLVVANADGTKALELLFIFGSTIKAAVTVEVLGTGKFASNAFTKENKLTVLDVVNAINEAKSGKVYLSVDGGATYDTSATNITSVGVDYASAIRNNIAEAASNDNSLGGMHRKQHQKGPKHKLNVHMMSKQLEMKGLELEADTDNIQIKDMAAVGVNVIALLYAGVQNQLIQTIDEIILDHLYALGVTHAVNVADSQGINYSLYIGNTGSATKEFSDISVKFDDILGEAAHSKMPALVNATHTAGYENQMTHGERLYSRILAILEFIGYQNRIGAPDFIVASGELCSCLKKQATYSACPVATTLSQNPELNYTGTIFETVSVYNNPRIDFNDPRILFGRRGNDTDTGAKFLAYDLAASRQTIAEGVMAEKIRVWSRFAIADVGFYPELNYYTAVFINDMGWV